MTNKDKKKYLTILRSGDKIEETNLLELNVNIEIESPEINSTLLKGFRDDKTLNIAQPLIESILYNCLGNGLYRKVLIYNKPVKFTVFDEDVWIMISDEFPKINQESCSEIKSFLKPFKYSIGYFKEAEEQNFGDGVSLDVMQKKNWKLVSQNKNVGDVLASDVAMLSSYK